MSVSDDRARNIEEAARALVATDARYCGREGVREAVLELQMALIAQDQERLAGHLLEEEVDTIIALMGSVPCSCAAISDLAPCYSCRARKAMVATAKVKISLYLEGGDYCDLLTNAERNRLEGEIKRWTEMGVAP